MTTPAVYSEDRVRRLRIVLWGVAGLGVLLALLAAYTLVVLDDGDDLSRFALFLTIVAFLLLVVSALALRALPQRDRRARRASILTGAVVVVLGLLMTGTWLGYLMPLFGLAVLFLALIPDEPEGDGT